MSVLRTRAAVAGWFSAGGGTPSSRAARRGRRVPNKTDASVGGTPRPSVGLDRSHHRGRRGRVARSLRDEKIRPINSNRSRSGHGVKRGDRPATWRGPVPRRGRAAGESRAPYHVIYYGARDAAPLRAVPKRDRSVQDALPLQTDVARSGGSTLPGTTKSLGVRLASAHTHRSPFPAPSL